MNTYIRLQLHFTSIKKYCNGHCSCTVNRERFAGLNFHSFRSLQEHHKSFPMNVSATLSQWGLKPQKSSPANFSTSTVFPTTQNNNCNHN